MIFCYLPLTKSDLGHIHFFFMLRQPLVGQGLLINVVSWSHSDTPHSVGLLWTSDQPDAEPCSWQHSIFTRTDIHAPSGIRTRNPSKRAAAEPRSRPCAIRIGLGRIYRLTNVQRWKIGPYTGPNWGQKHIELPKRISLRQRTKYRH
jgi:hypothetical protein